MMTRSIGLMGARKIRKLRKEIVKTQTHFKIISNLFYLKLTLYKLALLKLSLLKLTSKLDLYKILILPYSNSFISIRLVLVLGFTNERNPNLNVRGPIVLFFSRIEFQWEPNAGGLVGP